MKIKNLILPTTTLIKFSEFPKRNSKRISKVLGIEHEIIEHYNNWVLIDNEWYYYKNFPNYQNPAGNFLNELVGEFIADLLGLETIRYSIGCMSDFDESLEYGLLSKSFREKNFKYISPQKLYLCRNCTNLNILEAIRNNCKDDENYRNLVSQLLKMIAMDVYMHQTDRQERNYLFKKKNGELSLAPLYDYEEAFFVEPKKKTEYSANLYQAGIFGLNMNDKEELKKHPELIEIFELLLSLDIRDVLEKIASNYGIDIKEETFDKYSTYSAKRKELIKRSIK